jgi:N-acylglucosamine 2-epimerase
MPFWLKYGLDRVNGGVYTCIDRDGTLMDSTKSVWFQGRFGYTAAAAYNNIEKNQEWLAASKSCIDFIEAHCFDTDGRMYFEVMADGTPLRKRRYVFSECFAAIAMSEYSIASGDKTYAEKALKLFKDIRRFLATPGMLEPKYLPTQPAIGHSITMILINTAARVREAINDPILDQQIDESIEKLKLFIHPEFKALLETVTPDGQLIDTINGRVINPGHCIETAWFLLEEARHRQDKELQDMAITILDWSWEWGWDKEFGGIINFRDCRNFPAQDYSQDMKFWWPQTEAIIATLYAYEATGNEKYLEWHKMADEWAFKHLPDSEYGEWYGYLHRDGTVAQPAKGNIFKGPFHVPRMLTKASELCARIK